MPEDSNKPKPIATDFKNVARGLMMGGADIIPGVSGGTVALILGIYERLVAAISHIGLHLLQLLWQRKWKEAANHIDFRFLAALGCGVLIGVVGLAKLMNLLLTHYASYTFAAFFGLIIASSLLVSRMVKPKNENEQTMSIVIGITAAAFALWLVSRDVFHAQPGYVYTFFCGTIAICAMILPGISGAYILLLLGKYHDITDKIHNVTKFQATAAEWGELVTLAAGCVVGLILFSKLLRKLLARFHGPTMAAMCGFMLGSLYKIWPFRVDTTPEVEKLKEKNL